MKGNAPALYRVDLCHMATLTKCHMDGTSTTSKVWLAVHEWTFLAHSLEGAHAGAMVLTQAKWRSNVNGRPVLLVLRRLPAGTEWPDMGTFGQN